jgi:hypothetical protein
MNATITIDQREFDATLQKYIAVTRRTIDEVIARKTADVAVASLQNTKVADPAAIAAKYNTSTSVQYRLSKTGKLSRKFNVGSVSGEIRDTYAARLANLELQRKGKPPFLTKELVRKWIARRVAARSFIKSGWVNAAKAFIADVRAKGISGVAARGAGSDRRKNTGGGTMRRASEAMRASGEIFNNSAEFYQLDKNVNRSARTASALRVSAEGLDKGFKAATADMQQYIERKLTKALATNQ